MPVVEHKPPAYAEIPDTEPLLFANGPIQGAPDWQQRTYEIVSGLWVGTDTLHIANPRRELAVGTGEFTEEDYIDQVTWEGYHRLRGARFGGLLYWFAARDHSLPYSEGREYAKTTKKELNHTFGMLDAKMDLNIAVGFDPDYEDSERYIRLHLKNHGIEVHDTVESTAQSIVKQIEANYG